MLNLLSLLLGLIAFVIVIPGAVPFLGALNWIALPFAVAGAGLGALSSRNTGRNFNLIMLVVAAIRLSMGGGII